MQNPRLANRYAKSLLTLAIEKNQLDTVYKDMEFLQSVTKLNKEFVVVLRSPIITPEKKEAIIKKAADKGYTQFEKYGFGRIEDIDGIKYHLDNGGWVMLRASGTEPLLRVYAEGNSKEETLDILEDVKKTILM